MTKTAIIVVDMQNDFGHPDGSLYVPGGDQLTDKVNDLIDRNPNAVVVYTRDDHVDPGAHFAADGTDPDFVDTWPVHCKQGTWGAEFLDGLTVKGNPDEVVFYKGNHQAAFSGFEGRNRNGDTLSGYLARHGVTKTVLVGIALDFCVKATAIDARVEGLDAEVRVPLTAAVQAPVGDSDTATLAAEEMNLAGVNLSVWKKAVL